MPTQLRSDLRAEPVRSGVRTGMQPSTVSSNVRTQLWSVLQPMRAQHAVLAVLRRLPTAQGVRTEQETLALWTMSSSTHGVSSVEDDAHRTWMRTALAQAATEASATVVGEVVFGWRDRSLCARVRTESADFWLRVVTEQERWAGGDFWTGNTDANTIIGIPKPRVLCDWEWSEGTTRLRAELMTLAGGQCCSPTPELRFRIELTGTWWRALRESLWTLAVVPTSRTYLAENEIARRFQVFFGDRADPTVSEWTAAHTDLHWANLLAPDLAIVDWEGWGIAPAGFDAASLYLHSLLRPATAKRVHAELGELLDHRDGLISQLYVTTRMLLRIEHGDYPDLAVPLHRNAERVLKQLRSRL